MALYILVWNSLSRSPLFFTQLGLRRSHRHFVMWATLGASQQDGFHCRKAPLDASERRTSGSRGMPKANLCVENLAWLASFSFSAPWLRCISNWNSLNLFKLGGPSWSHLPQNLKIHKWTVPLTSLRGPVLELICCQPYWHVTDWQPAQHCHSGYLQNTKEESPCFSVDLLSEAKLFLLNQSYGTAN